MQLVLCTRRLLGGRFGEGCGHSQGAALEPARLRCVPPEGCRRAQLPTDKHKYSMHTPSPVPSSLPLNLAPHLAPHPRPAPPTWPQLESSEKAGRYSRFVMSTIILPSSSACTLHCAKVVLHCYGAIWQ